MEMKSVTEYTFSLVLYRSPRSLYKAVHTAGNICADPTAAAAKLCHSSELQPREGRRERRQGGRGEDQGVSLVHSSVDKA